MLRNGVKIFTFDYVADVGSFDVCFILNQMWAIKLDWTLEITKQRHVHLSQHSTISENVITVYSTMWKSVFHIVYDIS